jgi:hypothetical protein
VENGQDDVWCSTMYCMLSLLTPSILTNVLREKNILLQIT